MALVALLMAAPACASDEEEVAATVKRFYRAAAEGDGKQACDQLTPGALGGAGAGQCEAVISQMGRLAGAQAKRQLSAVEVRKTKVDGERATTEAQIPGQTPVTLELRELDGDWKLDSLGLG